MALFQQTATPREILIEGAIFMLNGEVDDRFDGPLAMINPAPLVNQQRPGRDE
jgi:hypothetical protein